MNSNRAAVLATIKRCEGTSISSVTKRGGYDVIVTGHDGKPETFTDFSTHPFAHGRLAKLIRPAVGSRKALYSTASGAYQCLLSNWTYYSVLLGLSDFGPDSQDAITLQQIKEKGALPLIDAGQFDAAIAKIAPLWASLPGAGHDQPEHPLDVVRSYYLAAGGTVSEA